MTDRVRDTCHTLLDHPESGRTREDLPAGLRSAPVRQYTIFYRAFEQELQVVRVLHGRRDVGVMF